MGTKFKSALAFFVVAGCIVTTGPSVGQSYPTRPIRLIAPFPAGGFNDVTARILAQRLGERLGQSMIVDNRPGGSTIIGTEIVAKAPADGHTLLYSGGGTFVINPVLLKNLPYDPIKSFAAIAIVCRTPMAILAHPSVPANNVKELIALIASKPGQYSYGSFGTASASHFAGEMFVSAAKVKLLHVPYKGSTPSLADLMGGQIPLSFDTVVVAMPQARANKIKIIAVTTNRRSTLLPDVPTVAESGYPEFNIDAWIGLSATARTPEAVVKRLANETIRVVGTKEVQDRFAAIGVETVGSSAKEFVDLIRQETPRFARIAQEAKITVE
jgi:tripartite-type tricarboxylate transporter receptor subunit TctC